MNTVAQKTVKFTIILKYAGTMAPWLPWHQFYWL